MYYLFKNFFVIRYVGNAPSPNFLTHSKLRLHLFSSIVCIWTSIFVFNWSAELGLFWYTLFFKCAHKEKSGSVRSGLRNSHLPLDIVLSLKNSAETSIVFLLCETRLHLAGTKVVNYFRIEIAVHSFIKKNWTNGSRFRNCTPGDDFIGCDDVSSKMCGLFVDQIQ